MTLRTGERDLHSGIYGGAALNAAPRADPDARRGDRARRPPARSRCARGSSPPTAGGARGLARAARRAPTSSPSRARARRTPRAAEEFYLRTFAEPALDVNGIESGSPHLQKTVLPVEAVANVSIRLAPGQQVDEIAAERSSGCCARRRPTGAELEIERSSSAPPGLVPPDARADAARARRVRAGARRAAGADPLGRHAADRRPRSPTRASRRSSPASRCRTRTSTRRTSGCSPSTSRSGSRPRGRCSKNSRRCEYRRGRRAMLA